MLLQVLLFCLLATGAMANSDSIVSAGIVRPRSLSEEAHNERIRHFWTDERLGAAIPLDIKLPGISGRISSTGNNVTSGPVSSVPGTLPSSIGTLGRAISSSGRQVATTGRVFWQVRSSSYSCSASVINSKTGDLISTAGHCVYDTDRRTWLNNNNWVFVPAYSDNSRPHGTWPARNLLSFEGWTKSADYTYDVAFVALSTLNQRHIQAVVGSQGIGFNYARSAYIHAFGYPSNLDSGRFLKSCAANTQPSRYTQNGFNGQGLPCNMGPGCSGGPWLQNVDEATGIGYVTSVNSFTISNVPNVMNGPYFGTSVQDLYNQATSM